METIIETIIFEKPEQLCAFCNEYEITKDHIIQIINISCGVRVYIEVERGLSRVIWDHKDRNGYYTGG